MFNFILNCYQDLKPSPLYLILLLRLAIAINFEMNEKINKVVAVNNIKFSNTNKLVLISGPCVVESLDHAVNMTGLINDICKNLNMEFVYKSSFDKANRTSIESKRGVGLEKSLKIFEELKKNFQCNIITDVHETFQCSEVSKYVDVLQIPAFLSRQTDLLIAAAKTTKTVMIKKGQFSAPWDMQNVVNKLLSIDFEKILLCERGVSFGYNTLVSDMRSIPIMQTTGFPVIFDAIHSCNSQEDLELNLEDKENLFQFFQKLRPQLV